MKRATMTEVNSEVATPIARVSAKPRIGPEADLCTDNEADLDEREGHRRARRPVRERDPKKREKQ